MIVLDVNVVLPLARPDQDRHDVTAHWLNERRASGEQFGVPGLVWHALVRIGTSRAVFDPPADLADVFAFADELRSDALYRDIEPGRQHLELFGRLCQEADARGNLIPDAAIAAIAIENGASVASFDHDFARFRTLRWIVPGAN